MLRRLALTALVVLVVTPASALAHGGNSNFESELRAVAPPTEGLDLRVLGGDDRLELRNDTGSTVLVEGYNKEPYLRFTSDGTVERNVHSPATYLNDDRYGKVDLPAAADEKAAPEWETVARNGRYEWHDHRIHWMSKDTPKQVTDEDKRTKVLDWKVPMSVDGREVAAAGTLTWVPNDSKMPLFAGLALGGLLFVLIAVWILRGRLRRYAQAGEKKEHAEVW